MKQKIQDIGNSMISYNLKPQPIICMTPSVATGLSYTFNRLDIL